MINTYARMIVFQYTVLKGAITQLRKGEEGMTTMEVLVITAGLVALAAAATAVLVQVAQKKVGTVENPPAVVLSTT
jgi:hypothetical protein